MKGIVHTGPCWRRKLDPDGTTSILCPAPDTPLIRWAGGAPERVLLGGISTTRGTRADFAEMMAEDCRSARSGELATPRIVVSSNGSVIARYHRDPLFRQLIDRADIVDADGMPMVIFTRLFWERPLPERVATTDFIYNACEIAVRDGLRFFFLGGKNGVAERAAARLGELYPGLQIAGTHHGYFLPEDEPELCDRIREAGTDVLWVGLGSPRQETFAFRQRALLEGVGWIRTCGGLFDFCSGDASRAPKFLQQIGLEWLYRAGLEPVRLGLRYLSTNPSAIWHLLTKSAEGRLPAPELTPPGPDSAIGR